MKLLDIDNLEALVGEEIGVSDWVQMTQERVNGFADNTIDHQFIHVDPQAAAKTPFGGPIAHGFLSLSMLSFFAENGCGVGVENMAMGINYGLDRVRFLQPVHVGKRIRGRSTLLSAEQKAPGQFMFKLAMTVEIEGSDKPALVAEWLTMVVQG